MVQGLGTKPTSKARKTTTPSSHPRPAPRRRVAPVHGGHFDIGEQLAVQRGKALAVGRLAVGLGSLGVCSKKMSMGEFRAGLRGGFSRQAANHAHHTPNLHPQTRIIAQTSAPD